MNFISDRMSQPAEKNVRLNLRLSMWFQALCTLNYKIYFTRRAIYAKHLWLLKSIWIALTLRFSHTILRLSKSTTTNLATGSSLKMIVARCFLSRIPLVEPAFFGEIDPKWIFKFYHGSEIYHLTFCE